MHVLPPSADILLLDERVWWVRQSLARNGGCVSVEKHALMDVIMRMSLYTEQRALYEKKQQWQGTVSPPDGDIARLARESRWSARR